MLAVDLAKRFESDGVSAIVYTDIARDGMMQGVNVEATVTMAEASTIPVIASGGITNIDDIRALSAVAQRGICGAITGRAITKALWTWQKRNSSATLLEVKRDGPGQTHYPVSGCR